MRFLCSPQRRFLVRTVHRVACLEGDHATPAESHELLAQLRGRQTQRTEVVVGWKLDSLDASTDVPLMRAIEHRGGAGMFGIGRLVDEPRLFQQIGFPDLLDPQHRQHDTLGIAERDRRAVTEPMGEFLRNVEGNRDRPEGAVCEPHSVADRFVVVPRHETTKRREAAVHEQLEIAKLARGQLPGRPAAGTVPQIRDPRPAGEQVHEHAAVRRRDSFVIQNVRRSSGRPS